MYRICAARVAEPHWRQRCGPERRSDLVDFNGQDRDAMARALARVGAARRPRRDGGIFQGLRRARQGRRQPRDRRRRARRGDPARRACDRFAPGVAVVSEEATAAGAEPVAPRRFFLVDPLDGTREFVARNGEFTVNIGLIEDGAPIAGAVYAPAIDRIWFGGRSAHAAAVAVGAALPETLRDPAGASGWRAPDGARQPLARRPARPTPSWRGSARRSASPPARR